MFMLYPPRSINPTAFSTSDLRDKLLKRVPVLSFRGFSPNYVIITMFTVLFFFSEGTGRRTPCMISPYDVWLHRFVTEIYGVHAVHRFFGTEIFFAAASPCTFCPSGFPKEDTILPAEQEKRNANVVSITSNVIERQNTAHNSRSSILIGRTGNTTRIEEIFFLFSHSGRVSWLSLGNPVVSNT